MSTRTFVGTLVGLGILVGVIASNYLPKLGSGFGFGSGDTTQVGIPDSTRTGAAPAADPPSAAKTEPAAVAEKTVTETTEAATLDEVPLPNPAKVVGVLIDGRDYFLQTGGPGAAAYRTATLDEITKLAQAAPGDDDHIRVRVARTKASRVTAEEALRERLSAAGLGAEAVRWEEELVER